MSYGEEQLYATEAQTKAIKAQTAELENVRAALLTVAYVIDQDGETRPTTSLNNVQVAYEEFGGEADE